jgi:hypothetical protein
MSHLINTESPAGQAFSRFCEGKLDIDAMSRLERDEFASVARMWLDTPAIANPRNPEDGPLPDFLRDFVTALEARPAPTTRTLKSSELRPGMVVWCHGMRCLIDGEVHSRKSTQGKPEGADDWRVYWTVALVLNRDDVPARAVPLSFTQPRLRNGLADEAAIARGEHRWAIQGNDNARWCVESD